MSGPLHPAAPHALPSFITAPGETDTLLVVVSIGLLVSLLVAGNLFLRLHTLPERMAHKSQKLQFEIVAVLGLLALFTHIHLFWVAGLILAMIDLPDFATSLSRMAQAQERIARSAQKHTGEPVDPLPPASPPEHGHGHGHGHRHGHAGSKASHGGHGG